jgi:3'(2'), 5'-bisphosphate nucleotidase
MLDLNRPEIRFAVEAVKKAGLLTRKVRSEMMVLSSLTKSDRSPVTVADLAAQAVIARFLKDSFPADILVGEESAGILKDPESETTLRQVTHFVKTIFPEAGQDDVCEWIDRGAGDPSTRFWTLDPIDGTKGFLRGDQYAVGLALIENGEVRMGVLGCPHLKDSHKPDPAGPGSLIVAAKGEGAWFSTLQADKKFKPMHASPRKDVTQAILLRSLDTGHTNTGEIEALRKHLHIEPPAILLDSLAKYGLLAYGAGDIYFRLLSPEKPDYREYIWDQASGLIVLEEAGGRVTDLDGKKLDFTTGRKLLNNRGVLASNGLLHDFALDALAALKI